MEENKMDTITELAEIIATQNAYIRDLITQLEDQHDVIIEYELNDEEEEKVTASFANDFLDAIDSVDPDSAAPFTELFDRYFGSFDE